VGEGGGEPRPDAAAVGRVFRRECGRSVAALIRAFGDIDLAEDAVQDAFATALGTWPAEGLPPNPGGWITTTARRRALDRLRREARGRRLLGEVAATATALAGRDDDGSPDPEGEPVADDRLRLIFTCCHPALARQAQVALTLRLLCGLSTTQIARCFLTTEPTMAQRLTRAKRKIKAAHIPYRVPRDHELPARLHPVLAVVYLLYTTGQSADTEPDLCAEAIRLARLLRELMPDEPEAAGLLALLLLTESRRAARTAPDGSLALLAEQDRTRWDRTLIEEGQTLVRWCRRRDRPGLYQLQAAINAVHAHADTEAHTEWPQIVALYDRLFALAPTPVIALNRAIAIAEVHGPATGLALVDALAAELDGYYPFHATRADLLRRLGRAHDAAAAYAHAAALAPTPAERDFLARGGRGAPRAARTDASA
jgi:RNA polymerase sigma-70 factor (ECF subfamily)